MYPKHANDRSVQDVSTAKGELGCSGCQQIGANTSVASGSETSGGQPTRELHGGCCSIEGEIGNAGVDASRGAGCHGDIVG